MEEKAKLIQAVINTLQTVRIEASIENMNTLMICHKLLEEIRDSLNEKEGEDGREADHE